MPFVLTLILFTLFLPQELSFYILGLRLTVTRLIFLLLTPVLVVKLFQKLSSGRYRYLHSDLFFVLTAIWMIYAPANVDGLIPALNHAGPEVLEFCVAYAVTRILLSEHGHALSFVDLLCRVIAIVALIGLLDPLTGRYVTHEFARKLVDLVPAGSIEWDDAYRLGLLRATGPIEHPIWYGFICGIGLLIAASVPIRWRRFVILSCSLGVIYSLSSAPLQVVFLGLCLLAYNHLMSRVPFRWAALIGVGVIGIVTVFLISNSPIGYIISHFTYSPQSGYYRVWTWYSVIDIVSRSPWYGLGYGLVPDADDINHSIDALWLVLAIHAGWPAAYLVGLSILAAGSVSTSGAKIDLTSVETKLGTTLGIVSFLTLYLAFTVHLLGILWTLTGLLAGLSAHLGELGRLRNPRGNAITRRAHLSSDVGSTA